MNTQILSAISEEMLKNLSRKEISALLLGEQSLRFQLQTEVETLRQRYKDLETSVLEIQGLYVTLKKKMFCPSTEKTSPAESSTPEENKNKKEKKKRTDFKKLPSERYPNAPVTEHSMSLETPPACQNCNEIMVDSGLQEVSEYLTVVPRKYSIVRQIRQKYRCKCCHGPLVTTPQLPRIAPGSSYSDDMILDISMSKFLDLIPIERYAAMAARTGFRGLPPNSLIEATHQLAKFMESTKAKIKSEVLSSTVLWADETPHKMLEGDKAKNWYLWSFSCALATYFECHGTRSGDVAHAFLEASSAEILVTDVYSGYGRAVAIANESRQSSGKPLLLQAFCNAHSRRKFKEAEANFKSEAQYYLRCYRVLYRLEAMGRERGLLQDYRKKMKRIFQWILKKTDHDLSKVSEKSELAKAIKYFQKNFDGLTLFLGNMDVPIDNNTQERILRSPVVGRKTWLGTHSKRGAETAATITTVVETCKLVGVNPREYLKVLVQEIHQGNPPFTPSEYKKRLL